MEIKIWKKKQLYKIYGVIRRYTKRNLRQRLKNFVKCYVVIVITSETLINISIVG